MKKILRFFLVGTAGSCLTALAQPPNLAHIEDVYDWHTVARVATDATDSAPLAAGFSAFGRRFELSLELNVRVQTRLHTHDQASRAFRGRLQGNPDSWARIVISSDGTPHGIIWDGDTLYGVESSQAAQPKIYRADDLIVAAETMSCGLHEAATNAAAMFAELTQASPEIARASGATLDMALGLVADGEFAALHTDTVDAMLIRANNVDGIFSEQLGLQVSAGPTDVFSAAGSDPFSDTTVAAELLDELAHFRGDTPTQRSQALTHLFTGRNLDGTTVGIAYLNTVCASRLPDGRSVGVSLTQANRGPGSALVESLIAAHEIGHNFGAPHDGEAGACASAPPGHIMAATLSPATETFSQCSVDIISAALPATSCLTPLADVDIAISGRSAAGALLTDTQFSYVVTVANEGFETATGTSVELSVDPALTVLAAEPQSGICTPPQSDLTCSLGEIPPGSSRSIAMTLSATLGGNFGISGVAASAEDASGNNNAFNETLAVTPASDLALVAAPRTLDLDTRTTIVVMLENRSSVAASDVLLSGTFSSGLELSEADFDGTACELDSAARSLECRITELPGFSSGELSMSLSGVEAGSERLSLSVTATEPDPNTANNVSEIALEVAAAPGQPSAQTSGGGGSLGPAALLFLLGASRLRRGRPRGKANFS